MIRPEFEFHKLNDTGIEKAKDLAQKFTDLANYVEDTARLSCPELTISIRKLEEACFYAKKAMAKSPEHQV